MDGTLMMVAMSLPHTALTSYMIRSMCSFFNPSVNLSMIASAACAKLGNANHGDSDAHSNG